MNVSDFPYPTIEIACTKCSRRGAYRTTSFVPTLALPDLLALVSKSCPRQTPLEMLDRCGAYFPQLATKKGPG